MSPDQLFKKHQVRGEASLRRQKARRAPYDIVLIVCEGKTEKNYFSGLRDFYKLSNANIIICDDRHGSDPLSVVNCAIDNYKKDKGYDRVYCVFDRDKHNTFHDALQKLKHSRCKRKLHGIISEPCFEFWMLLHYKYTTQPFCAAGDESNCDKVISALKEFMPDYQKGDRNVFEKTKAMTDTAINHAKKVMQYHQTSGTKNPSTGIYLLVEYLSGIKALQ